MQQESSGHGRVTYLVTIVREQATTVEIVNGDDGDSGWDAARAEALDRAKGGEVFPWAVIGDPWVGDVTVQDMTSTAVA